MSGKIKFVNKEKQNDYTCNNAFNMNMASDKSRNGKGTSFILNFENSFVYEGGVVRWLLGLRLLWISLNFESLSQKFIYTVAI